MAEGQTRNKKIRKGLLSFLVMILCFLFAWLCFWVIKDEYNSITTTSMSLADFDFSDSNNRSLPSLNITFNVDMELRNYLVTGGVKYENSTMFLRYKGKDIDVVPLNSGGYLKYKGTRRLSLTLRFVGQRLLEDMDSSALTYSDLLPVSGNGVLKLQTHVRIPGKGFLFCFWVNPVAKSTQELSINLTGRSFTYRECYDYVNLPGLNQILCQSY